MHSPQSPGSYSDSVLFMPHQRNAYLSEGRPQVNKPTFWANTVTWIKDHKKQIFCALIAIGAFAMTLGAGLLVGAVASSSLIAIKWIWFVGLTTTLTTAGKIALGGAITLGVGAAVTSYGAAALIHMKNPKKV